MSSTQQNVICRLDGHDENESQKIGKRGKKDVSADLGIIKLRIKAAPIR